LYSEKQSDEELCTNIKQNEQEKLDRNSLLNFELKKIHELKSQSPHDIFQINFDDKIISLQRIDDTDESSTLLLEWRNKYWNFFNSKFDGNMERTKKWINTINNTPNKILFFIICDGEKIGHLGINLYNHDQNSIEIWSVVRAVKHFSPGLMEIVLKNFFKWIFSELNISTIYLNVFSDVWKAINLYERCGMQTIGTTPLKQIRTNDGWIWKNTTLQSKNHYAQRYMNRMKISSYLKSNPNLIK